ncbi:MAG: hypothetical protein K9M17_06730 [Mariprofundaceae bacterium]|nr:hypothetical protein [Mariprofundaceae bacterium]
MNDIAQRLRALKQAWQSIPNVPDDLTMLGLPGKSGQFIEDSIDELACMAAELVFAPTASMVMIKSLCENHLKLLEAFFHQEISGHPSMQMLTFVSLLQQLQTSLREVVPDASIRTRSHRESPSRAA